MTTDLVKRLEAAASTLESRLEVCRNLINTGPFPMHDLIEQALKPTSPDEPALPGYHELKLMRELRPAIDAMRSAAALLKAEG